MTTSIKDILDLPDRVHKGDFVLNLSTGVDRPKETLAEYVVTPQLVSCFDDALSFIRGAVETRSSKACYLHGSFGSGKSHFMAVLNLLLQGNRDARAIPELAEVVAKHHDWTENRSFLLVPYHMIGARNVESALLGGYADFVRRNHPDAPIPGIYQAEGLFRDAEQLRQQMGDEVFFARLNHARPGGDREWGDLETGWDAASYENARNAPPNDEQRTKLVGDLVSTWFQAYHQMAQGTDEAYLPLDQGLSVISRHAAGLGYDALILFLDELILWLASHAADLQFVHQEGQKLDKLVESQSPDRPAPIVSFVARQRDLRELVGEQATGADKLSFSDALQHWEGRFDKITLEDRNLPKVAEKRILKPKNEAARQQLDAAFERTKAVREEVMNTLLTSKYDQQTFRQVYPFSPALVDTLVGVSGVLQRERTALKVMLQLLVDQKETLKLGDLVPVGDLFDVIASGDEAFTEDMKVHFDNAKRLYHHKLLPMLERQHGARREDLDARPSDDPARTAFHNDDRLVKTLLLAALVPGVESLRGINANRLAALNHGTIQSPIPGRESQIVLNKCRTWATEVREIKIGEEANPTIAVQLTGIDTDAIVEQARNEDNQGNRIRRVREMVLDQLGIEDSDTFPVAHRFTWRGTARSCEVVFGNIRTLPDSSLEAGGDGWKLVIDYPFERGHSPKDDIERLERYRNDNPQGTRTIGWAPSFFSEQARKDLGLLVVLDHILAGERFDGYVQHLSPQDRPTARTLLKNQHSQLEQRVLGHLEAAYGIRSQAEGSVDPALDLSDHFVSLDPAFTPQPPVAANLAGAMENLLGQALAAQFPAHPVFEAEIKTSNLKKVYEAVRPATQAKEGRTLVDDKPTRSLVRQIANPLRIGEMHETHFVLGEAWKNHFNRKAAETGETITVAKLRAWTDDPRPMGLPTEVQNLIILLYAEQTDRSFFLHNGPYEPTLTSMPDTLELRQAVLPAQETWQRAVDRAGQIFGLTPLPLLTAANVAGLARQLREKAQNGRSPCEKLVRELRERCPAFGVDPANAPRVQTASALLSLLSGLASAETDHEAIEKVGDETVGASDPALGTCLKQADAVLDCMQSVKWQLFDAIRRLDDERAERADAIRSDVANALDADEHVTPLRPALDQAEAAALELLTPKPTEEEQGGAGQGTGPKPPHVVEEKEERELDVEGAEAILRDLRAKSNGERAIRLTIQWRVEEHVQAGDDASQAGGSA